jgi:hypothetical protein
MLLTGLDIHIQQTTVRVRLGEEAGSLYKMVLARDERTPTLMA